MLKSFSIFVPLQALKVCNLYSLTLCTDENHTLPSPSPSKLRLSLMCGLYILPNYCNGISYLTYLEEVLPEFLEDVTLDIP